MAKRMKTDPSFLAEQLAGVYDPQVERINRFVDGLTASVPGSFVPYIAPHYNAEEALILVVSSNPGPATRAGFLSIENNDESAKLMSEIWDSVSLTDQQALPWNAYPWYIHDIHGGAVPPSTLAGGMRALMAVLTMHPRLRAIIAHGNDAHEQLRRSEATPGFQDLISARGIRIWNVRHTSPKTYQMSASKKLKELEKLRVSYREAMEHVGLDPLPAVDAYDDEVDVHSSLLMVADASIAAIRSAQPGLTRREAARKYVETVSGSDVREILVCALGRRPIE